MRREKLSESELDESLKQLEGWKYKKGKIKKKFEFANFAEALVFANQVGEIAERLDHHPDITFGWGYAKVKTTTHDRDGVTEFDIELAKQIDALAPPRAASIADLADAEEKTEKSAGNGT
jgi:4a-hydroxytetrahydrobiopterin dehydratase